MYKTKLQYILKTEGRSQTWLAKRTEKSVGQINQYVLGEVEPGMKNMVLIAQALDRSVEDVFFDSDFANCGNKNTHSGGKQTA